jgi:oligopeptide/dipeptide ABC transporter ATP-binding protein
MSTSLTLEGITQSFRQGHTEVHAVQDVSLSLGERDIVCLVGESGCGKSTTGRMAAGLLRPTGGRVLYDGQDITQLRGKAHADFRRAVQMVHQDPYASLNPVLTIYQAMSAPLLKHGFAKNHAEARRRAVELLELTDLTPAAEILDKYPHQLSGGQRQRVSVARALTVNPRFIIADEAVSMVDVSIRASLLNMLVRLNKQLGVSFLFITHDLALARYFALGGRIAVMYLGRIVELGPTEQVIHAPTHPYTQALLSAIPEADPDITRSKQRVALRSYEIPSLTALPPGCTFHPRCPVWVAGLCDRVRPELTLLPDGRETACHVAVEGATDDATQAGVR